MEWKIKPVTEEEVSDFFGQLWPIITDEEKNYLREMHMSICVSNAKWRTELELILKGALNRKSVEKPVANKSVSKQEIIEEELEETTEEDEEEIGEVDIEEREPKFKMRKRIE